MKHANPPTATPTTTHVSARAGVSRPRPIRSDTPTENSHNDVPARSRDLEIREVAYALYEARGRVDGHELDDWLQATAQIEQRAAPVGSR